MRLLAGLLLLALVASAAYFGARQVWFLGADEAGRVALYRGLPYDLPFGIELYTEIYSAPVTVDALPADRREAATNHELRSRADAVSLLEDLQRAAEADAAANQPAAKTGSGGGGSGNQPGGGGGG